MRYIAIAVTFCFMLAPLEAKTYSTHVEKVRLKKNRVKGRKAPKPSKSKVRRHTAN